jgi:hypothetical protein
MNLRKILSKHTVLGISGLVLSLFLIAYYADLLTLIFDFLEINFSADNQLKDTSKLSIQSYVTFLITLLILVSLYLIFNLQPRVISLLKSIISFEKVSSFFFKDNAIKKNDYAKYIFWVGSGLALFAYFNYLVTGKEENEGFMEIASSYLYLFSIIILIISLLKIKTIGLNQEARRKIFIIITIILFAIIALYGEEISWGQQFFKWESSDVFAKYNYQNETNLHNFYNPLFKFIYPIIGMLVFIFLSMAWFFPSKKISYLTCVFFPHQSLFFISFLFACTSFLNYREVSEQILTLFIFLYSIRICMVINFPGELEIKQLES